MCVFAHSVHGVERARKVRSAWRALFLFLIQKEQAIATNNETFINPGIRFPCFSADVLKKCALIALHVMAEGEYWKMGFHKESTVGE